MYMYMHQKKNTKMENSLLMIFDEIWQKSRTIVLGFWPNFKATIKIHKKSNIDQNQLKLSTQHKYMYMHQKM